MKTFFVKHFLLKKFLISIGIIVVFLLGRLIPVPLLSIDAVIEDSTGFLNQSAMFTGANLSTIGLFSLGLSPGMSAMILMRLLSFGRFKDDSKLVMEFRQNILMLIIATIQGLSLSLNLTYQSGHTTVSNVILTSLVFITGAFVVSWLSKINTIYGIGGSTLLIIVSMVLGLLNLIPTFMEVSVFTRYQIPLTLLVLWTLFGIFIMTILNQSEYRILVKRVAIHSNFDHQNFLPLKINAAGGMPMMYAISIMMLPQYLILIFKGIFPAISKWENLLEYFSLTNPIGLIIYAIVVIYLNISFALLNVDPTNVAKNFRREGDFIPNVRPGKQTKNYIVSKLLVVASFSGIIMALLLIVPVVQSFFYERLVPLVSVTSMGLMITGMFLTIREEIKTIRLRRQYTTIFERKG